VSVVVFVVFSIRVTEWRTAFVREANNRDNQSNSRAIDSLLNYETVKYFNNERFEAEQYDEDLDLWEQARLKNRSSMAILNIGQAFIIGASMVVIMAMAVREVASGECLSDPVVYSAECFGVCVPRNSPVTGECRAPVRLIGRQAGD
jgi:ATP-binding cassette subfamily B protein